MSAFYTYLTLIGISALVILSYLFNWFSQKTRVPSVLLLILVGIGLKYLDTYFNLKLHTITILLPLLGTIGVIMIVLEGALDLKLSKERAWLLLRSFIAALLILIITTLAITFIIYKLHSPISFLQATLYALPLSVVSSAIIIPSVGGLNEEKREFVIYESTFSDILGIMFFNFLIADSIVQNDKPWQIVLNILGTLALTLIISIALSYLLVYMFHRITSRVKMFFMLAVLSLLYAIGKFFHISSLLLILVFGLVLNNVELFFWGRLQKFLKINLEEHVPIVQNFKVLTAEMAFLVRTFFFVVFGMTIALEVLTDMQVLLIGSLIVATLYAVRYLNLVFFVKSNVLVELFLAPRGLVTLLLFYSIPSKYMIEGFTEGIYFYVIIMTNLLMMVGLWLYRDKEAAYREVEAGASPYEAIFDTPEEQQLQTSEEAP